MDQNYSNIKREASSKLFDLIIKGSVKEARKILSELSEKFQESHETKYLKGLEDILEAVRNPSRVIEAIDELEGQQWETGRIFTKEEAKALGDLRNYHMRTLSESRGLWKPMKNSKMKAKNLFFFIQFTDFSEGVADTQSFFLAELENFFGTLFPLLL